MGQAITKEEHQAKKQTPEFDETYAENVKKYLGQGLLNATLVDDKAQQFRMSNKAK